MGGEARVLIGLVLTGVVLERTPPRLSWPPHVPASTLPPPALRFPTIILPAGGLLGGAGLSR